MLPRKWNRTFEGSRDYIYDCLPLISASHIQEEAYFKFPVNLLSFDAFPMGIHDPNGIHKLALFKLSVCQEEDMFYFLIIGFQLFFPLLFVLLCFH